MTSGELGRSKARVLVVDDDVDLLALLEAGLEAGGFEVEVCGSAERALDMLEVVPYDIVLTDINLPGMSCLPSSPAGDKRAVIYRSFYCT